MTTQPLTLELIEIATPCEASWNEMRGDDRVRFCSHCKLNVYNLSDMPRAEAEQLVQQREGKLCVRFFKRHDGTVLTRDCPVGIRAVRQRLGALGRRAGGPAAGDDRQHGFRQPHLALAAEWVPRANGDTDAVGRSDAPAHVLRPAPHDGQHGDGWLPGAADHHAAGTRLHRSGWHARCRLRNNGGVKGRVLPTSSMWSIVTAIDSRPPR